MSFEYSLRALAGGESSVVAVSAVNAVSAVLGNHSSVIVTPTVDVFVRRGSDPVAMATGVDQILLAGNTYRLLGFTGLDKLGFITSAATGSVYLTPGA